MRNKKGKSLRKLSWVVGTRVAGAVLLVVVLLSVNGCTPEINNDWKANADVEMMFNLLANPVSPKSVPQPIYLAINPVTKKIDLSQADIPLPAGLTWKREIPCTELLNGTCTEMQSADCANLTAEQQQVLTIASCDVYKYLLSLDGFPTAAPITMQSSLQIDTTTIRATNDGNEALDVFCTDRTNLATTKYVTSDFQIDSRSSQSVANAWDLILTINPAFDINRDCVVAIRGYENGIKSKDGAKPFMASQTFFLLKEKDSLTCGLTKGDEGLDTCQTNPPTVIPEICKYYPMVSGAPGNEGKSQIYISGLMCVLEYLRTTVFGKAFIGIDLVTGSKTISNEAAIAFAFPTHSTPVIENIPGKREPVMDAAANKIYIKVNGTVDKTQLVRGQFNWKTMVSTPGTVFLIKSNPQTTVPAIIFPTYDVTFDSTTNQIVISNVAPPLDSNNTYLVFITKGTGNPGDPKLTNMIPFMSTILVTSSGPLYDMDTEKLLVTTLSGLSDATPSDRALAKSAECQRLDLTNQFYGILEPYFATNSIGLASDKLLFVGQVGTPSSINCSP